MFELENRCLLCLAKLQGLLVLNQGRHAGRHHKTNDLNP